MAAKAKKKKAVPVKTKNKSKPAKAAPAKKSTMKKAASKAPAAKAAAPKNPAVKISGALMTPLEDRLLVQVQEMATQTAGGIIIPGSVGMRSNRGIVLAKGRGRRNKKGSLRPLDVNVGDEVLFGDYAGTQITLEGQEVLILREEEVLCVLN